MNEYYGYTGRTLTVNLTAGTSVTGTLSWELASNFLGGKGFGAQILSERLKPGIEPLSLENIMVFATGPLTGTPAPGSSRTIMSTKSPLTGLWLDSNCGGFFGPELKQAGYDILIIEGRAPEPVYLLIENDRVEVRSAVDLWGQDTFETTEKLKERHGSRFMTACIGPAGEKLAPIAAIMSEYRSFGRGGGGAVMGSKNLKAIAVRGSLDIKLHDPDKFMMVLKEIYDLLYTTSAIGGGRTKYGTNVVLSSVNEAGIHPVRNFSNAVFDGLDRINEKELAEKYFVKNRACFACPIACSKASKVADGKYEGRFTEGPEYENVWSFGAQCGNSEMGAIIHAEYLCDKYGIDAISAGNITGFAMECFEKGLITENELGFPLNFGDDEAMLQFVELLGRGEGMGELFSNGVARAAEEIGKGSDFFAIQVKGMELPAYDPRGVQGMGLAYATSDRGGCHLRAFSVGAEVLSPTGKLDPLGTGGKAEFIKNNQDLFSIIDCTGLCLFAASGMTLKFIVQLLEAATGIYDFASIEEVMKIGERVYNQTRIFNVREGADRKLDTLPGRLLTEAMPDGPAQGHVVQLEPMLNEYYQLRGWDQDGIPDSATLERLNIK